MLVTTQDSAIVGGMSTHAPGQIATYLYCGSIHVHGGDEPPKFFYVYTHRLAFAHNRPLLCIYTARVYGYMWRRSRRKSLHCATSICRGTEVKTTSILVKKQNLQQLPQRRLIEKKAVTRKRHVRTPFDFYSLSNTAPFRRRHLFKRERNRLPSPFIAIVSKVRLLRRACP